MEWRGKTIVITGGSAGVGYATARAFAARGANLALLARDEERLRQGKQELESFSVRVATHSVDVANAVAVKEAARAIESELGEIDLWINNATVSVVGAVRDISDDEFRRVTEVTYLGYVHGTRAALEMMERRGKGKIVQISSGLAYRSVPLQSAYCAAKHAIVGFTESLRTELLHDRSPIGITMVHLPAVNTPQFGWTENHTDQKFRPMSPIYSPEFIAEQIVWAAEHERREVFIGGMTAFGAFMQKISPALVDWYLAKTAYQAQLDGRGNFIHRESNLWKPVRGYFGAQGEFVREEKSWSFQAWFTRNRLAVLCAGGLALLLARTRLQKLKPELGGRKHVQQS